MSVQMFFTGLILFVSLIHGPAAADSTRLFRCENQHGQIEFRQGPCIEGRQQEVEVRDVRMGWDVPVYKVEVKKRKPAAKAKKGSNKNGKKKERCFKTRQRLDSVNRKLRRGYKAGQGADLRHKRRQYEEYLGQFCE